MKYILATLVMLASVCAYADGSVTIFVNLTPAGSFQGVSSKTKGNLIKQGAVFKADKLSVTIESFKTGIELRDEHLWKHLNSVKHPKATLTDVKGQGGKGTAVLEVNGVKKPIAIAFVEKGKDIAAKFKVKASDFGLSKAEYLGVGVQDEVVVEVTLPFLAK